MGVICCIDMVCMGAGCCTGSFSIGTGVIIFDEALRILTNDSR
jgi:hypothetical protein